MTTFYVLFMHYCHWQLLYALLKLTIFVCTTAIIDNFCLNICKLRHIFSTFAIDKLSCSITIKELCMYYNNWIICKHYYNRQLLYELLQLQNILCCTNNIEIISYIVHNNNNIDYNQFKNCFYHPQMDHLYLALSVSLSISLSVSPSAISPPVGYNLTSFESSERRLWCP